MSGAEMTWTVEEALDTRRDDLEGALIRRARTRLCHGVVPFEFTMTVEERTDAGLVLQYRLGLVEVDGNGRTGPISAELFVRPVIPAASVDKMGPWERTALRQAARKLLRSVAEQATVRGAAPPPA